MVTLLLLVAVGFGAGILSGLFGVGGGIVMVPAMIFLLKYSPTTATGTSLGALLLPVGAFGAWEYYKAGHLNVTAALCLAIGLLLGAGFGARFALSLAPDTLRRMFAVFLVLAAVRLWFK